MLRDFRRLSRRDLRRLGDQPVLISVEGVAGRYLPADSCFEIPFFFTACKAIIPFGMKCLALVAKGRPGRRDIGGGGKGFGGSATPGSPPRHPVRHTRGARGDRKGARSGKRVSVRV